VHPEASVAFTAKANSKKPNCSDELTLTQVLSIPEEVELWKESMRVDFTSLINKLNAFQVVTKNKIPSAAKISHFLILLKSKRKKLRNQFHKILKKKCRLVMDWR
jgi:hypothetical protein